MKFPSSSARPSAWLIVCCALLISSQIVLTQVAQAQEDLGIPVAPPEAKVEPDDLGIPVAPPQNEQPALANGDQATHVPEPAQRPPQSQPTEPQTQLKEETGKSADQKSAGALSVEQKRVLPVKAEKTRVAGQQSKMMAPVSPAWSEWTFVEGAAESLEWRCQQDISKKDDYGVPHFIQFRSRKPGRVEFRLR